ncbi:hypothetical protein I317_00062 [Kwoniella heveanensis CBS 569]|nr:hypothetical protein I317_00062 [Kwoniella heveanensis CBS 569]
MPSVPQPTSTTRAKHYTPPNPNLPHDTFAQHPVSSSSTAPTPNPAPAVTQSASHVGAGVHLPPRRFLGGIPENIVNSTEVDEKRRRFRDLRRKAIDHLPLPIHPREGDGADGGGSMSDFGVGGRHEGSSRAGGVIRGAARKISVIKRGLHGEQVREELDLDQDNSSSSEDDEHQQQSKGKRRKKKKKKRKDVWIGESFDIGREFFGCTENEGDEYQQDDRTQDRRKDLPKDQSVSSAGTYQSHPGPRRPAVSTRTTQDTFVTARTEFSSRTETKGDRSSSFHVGASAGASRSTLILAAGDNAGEGEGYHIGSRGSLTHSVTDTSSPPELTPPNRTRISQSSSLQPLITSPLDEHELDGASSSQLSTPKDGQPRSSSRARSKSSLPNINLSNRLKSALRHSSRPNIKTSQSALPHPVSDPDQTNPKAGTNDPQQPRLQQQQQQQHLKSKSVQFPVDLVQASYRSQPLKTVEEARKRKGNKAPVDPQDVLSRAGDEAAGTSAGAVENALDERDEEEAWEEDRRPGEVIMRDRMLVRVGYHREEHISGFDETAQRRNPCARLDHFEEFIVVWRKGQIELYQDYRYPLQERVTGHKHLCFVIPLLPNRTSLSIFNPQDITLCLATSINKLQNDVDHLMRSSTSRAGAMRDRVKQSRQIQWLRGRRRGTQVFIMKIAERSRSLDWYWEVWRDLGGELPERFDIAVPSLQTSVRLLIPQEGDGDYMVGSAAQCRTFEKGKVIDECWDMLEDSMDVGELKRQSEQAEGEKLRLKLAWKSSDGNLDWVAYGTTVQQKSRGWALLAGLARAQVEPGQRELQLRPARHQPKYLKLEDGTHLNEPPGIEGYLIRHKDSGPKEQVYIAAHEGNIFVSNMKSARPPLLPQKEASSPASLFPEMYRSFIDAEHRRSARFLERCAGCIDLRDIISVNIVKVVHPATATVKNRIRSLSNPSHMALAQQHAQDRIGNASDAQGERERDDQQEEGGKMFDVEVATGGTVRLEANSHEVAMEWVTRLRDLMAYAKRRHRVDARQRMDAIDMHASDDPFAGTHLSNESDNVLSEIWDMCVIEGCRSTCISGRLYMRKERYDKFRLKYLVLTGGSLVSFKIKKKNAFHVRKKRYPLFGAYVYSGMLALDELPAMSSNDAFAYQTRVYQDGLRSADGVEDTTFCVRLGTHPSRWGKKTTQPWEMEEEAEFLPPGLSKKPPGLLIFRARSKLERDRWVWAINAEMERQVRAHVKQEEALRQYGKVPDRWM